MIASITPEHLRPEIFERLVRPDLARTHYFTQSWDPDFYVALAREGFIAIAHRQRGLGDLLLPELQRSYAVLDWPELHVSRHVRRLRRVGHVDGHAFELVIRPDPMPVIDALVEYHGARCWLIAPYRELVRDLARRGAGHEQPAGALVMRATELRAGPDRELVAGELGYTIGRTYTSLSGFCRPEDAAWRHFGSLQLVLLAERLRDAGYAFWNLGHPHMAYKRALGARIVKREPFLRRWHAHRDEAPAREIFGGPS